MEIKEAVKNLEKEMKCRKEECLGQECREGEGGCPYFVNYDVLVESLQMVVEWCKCALAKECEGSENE